MNSKIFTGTSRPTLLRLPSYRRLLKDMLANGRVAVSCTNIAQQLHLDPTQVRKDLAATGIVGRPKVGYDTGELLEAIETFLGWNNTTDAFLVGVGNLGAALLGYAGFADYGLNIIAAFDVADSKIGTTVHGREVFPLEKLPDLAERMHVKIGILTAPADAAQPIATRMVLAGLRAIWNFSPAHLEVPQEIVVEDVRLSESLAVLSNRLTEALKKS